MNRFPKWPVYICISIEISSSLTMCWLRFLWFYILIRVSSSFCPPRCCCLLWNTSDMSAQNVVNQFPSCSLVQKCAVTLLNSFQTQILITRLERFSSSTSHMTRPDTIPQLFSCTRSLNPLPLIVEIISSGTFPEWLLEYLEDPGSCKVPPEDSALWRPSCSAFSTCCEVILFLTFSGSESLLRLATFQPVHSFRYMWTLRWPPCLRVVLFFIFTRVFTAIINPLDQMVVELQVLQ